MKPQKKARAKPAANGIAKKREATEVFTPSRPPHGGNQDNLLHSILGAKRGLSKLIGSQDHQRIAKRQQTSVASAG